MSYLLLCPMIWNKFIGGMVTLCLNKTQSGDQTCGCWLRPKVRHKSRQPVIDNSLITVVKVAGYSSFLRVLCVAERRQEVMLKYIRALQTCCFPLPSRKRELREIEQIHQELNGRLNRRDRARLPVPDGPNRKPAQADSGGPLHSWNCPWLASAGGAAAEGILSTEQAERGSCSGKATSIG